MSTGEQGKQPDAAREAPAAVLRTVLDYARSLHPKYGVPLAAAVLIAAVSMAMLAVIDASVAFPAIILLALVIAAIMHLVTHRYVMPLCILGLGGFVAFTSGGAAQNVTTPETRTESPGDTVVLRGTVLARGLLPWREKEIVAGARVTPYGVGDAMAVTDSEGNFRLAVERRHLSGPEREKVRLTVRPDSTSLRVTEFSGSLSRMPLTVVVPRRLVPDRPAETRLAGLFPTSSASDGVVRRSIRDPLPDRGGQQLELRVILDSITSWSTPARAPEEWSFMLRLGGSELVVRGAEYSLTGRPATKLTSGELRAIVQDAGTVVIRVSGEAGAAAKGRLPLRAISGRATRRFDVQREIALRRVPTNSPYTGVITVPAGDGASFRFHLRLIPFRPRGV